MKRDEQVDGALILGVPRSGTTLLRRILGAHPMFASPGETSIFVGVAKFLQVDSGVQDINIGGISGLAYAGFAEEDIVRRLQELAFGIMDDYALRVEKPFWIEKTAFNAFYTKEIERVCGNRVRYVCMLRHGLDVACSIKELCEVNGGYLAEIHEYVRKYPFPMEAFCRLWSDLTGDILDLCRRRPSQTLLIKYEDLIENPHTELQKMCEFLGSDWRDEYLAKALEGKRIGLGDWKTYGKKELDRGSIGRWKLLSTPTVSRLAQIVNPMLELCGYATLESGVEIDKNHRYEMALMVEQLKRELE